MLCICVGAPITINQTDRSPDTSGNVPAPSHPRCNELERALPPESIATTPHRHPDAGAGTDDGSSCRPANVVAFGADCSTPRDVTVICVAPESGTSRTMLYPQR